MERATRLRENKRNHRQRQKEYIGDLERRLQEGRKRDVQATQEVQTAAQRVVLENKALRELLHHYGIRDDAIDRWLNGQRGLPMDTTYGTQDSNLTSASLVSIGPVCPTAAILFSDNLLIHPAVSRGYTPTDSGRVSGAGAVPQRQSLHGQ